MRAKALIFLFFSIVEPYYPQHYIEPGKQNSFNITVNQENCTIKTQILKNVKAFTPDNSLSYMWYQSQKIMETTGGFDGKLLNGYYTSFYLNDQLKEKGSIIYGLKHKQWIYWYPDGKLKEIINWKNGRKNGLYKVFNDYGYLMAKGKFKNDLLHGSFYTYDANGKIIDRKKYKNGIEIIKKTKTEKPKKIKKDKIKKEHKTKELKNTTV